MNVKKHILFVIGSLNAGGAEKSLTSLLNSLPDDKYTVDLMLLRREGLFLPLVPSNVNIVDAPIELQALTHSPLDLDFFKLLPIKFRFRKVFRFICSKYFPFGLDILQSLWQKWKDDIPVIQKKYDVAVSYMDGTTNYFVIDKVCAKKKILWVHNDYSKLTYNSCFDKDYFSKADSVITISPLCQKSLVQSFPDIAEKFLILENVSDPEFILKLSKQYVECKVFNSSGVRRIISVGRFTEQKNYPLSIDAAHILDKRGYEFNWFIIGDGSLKESIERKIASYSLEKKVYLLGLQSNPYYFIANSDIFVQSSVFEGKSIAIDEAKILAKPIVVTDFPTVFDSIVYGENGVIVKQTPNALADGIQAYLDSSELMKKHSQSLLNERIGNLEEVNKYCKLFDL